jgi:hypothetical protein
MDDIRTARRIRAEFMLDQARLAQTCLSIAENPATYPLMAARNLKDSGRVLTNINQFLARGDVDPELEPAIVTARNNLHERLSRFET